MNNNVFQLNKIIQLGIGVLILGVFLIPYTSKAVSAPLTYPNYYRFQDIRVNNGTKNIDIYSDVYVSLSKNFNLVSGGRNLTSPATIAIGSNITSNSSKATGSFNLGGSAMGTPPLDGYLYYRNEDLVWRDSINGGMDVAVSWAMPFGGIVVDNTTYTLSSNNSSVISCSGTTCSAVGTGSATITVNWVANNEYYTVGLNSFYIDPAYNGSTRYLEAFAGAWVNGETTVQNFSVSSISYNINVYQPDRPPVVNNITVSDISYTTAKVNWNYSDPDGDVQTLWNVQVATDTSFGVNTVTSNSSYGTETNAIVTNLIPNTRYYTRVQAYNAKAGTGWVNGPSFTTLANNPPNLDQLSCNGESTGYTSGKVNWNYTGTDEPGDLLVFKLRYKKTTESEWSPTVNLPGNRAGAQDIANLISGYGYNVEISLNDNRNVHLGDRWKGCGIFTTNEYPEPSVDFNLRSGSTTVAKGGTLTVKTGDPISTNWKITNTDGLNSCALSTTGVRDIFRENNIEFESSRQNNNIAADKADQTYTINVSCTGKDARVPKSVNASITLVIQSYPLISCSIVNKVVSTESPIAQVEGKIENANSPYTWKIKRFAGENYGSPITSTNTIQNFTLDYNGLGLGKYKPVIQANGLGSRISEKECGEISNFGNRSIQEVAK
jgi:hypothetical protein